MKSHDLARPSVGDQAQIHKRLLGPDVSDVGHPYLVASGHFAALAQVLKHRQIRVEIRRFRPWRWLSLHQQPHFAQFFKEPIPAHLDSGRLQFQVNHVIELSHPQTRLLPSFRSHQFQHQFHIHGLPAPSRSARIVILGRHVRPFADPRHFELRVGRDRPVRRPPACFFLNPSRLWFISSQATARNARSNASSICVSARASLTRRSSLRSWAASFTSSAFSTRINLPYLPLPNCRTHLITVLPPLILYLR